MTELHNLFLYCHIPVILNFSFIKVQNLLTSFVEEDLTFDLQYILIIILILGLCYSQH